MWLTPRVSRLLGWLGLQLTFVLWAVMRWTGRFCWFDLPRYATVGRWLLALVVLGALGWAAEQEIGSSTLQAAFFTRLNHRLAYAVQPGPSDTVHFPAGGPYDDRLGYSELPQFISLLDQHGFAVQRQARWSPGLDRFVSEGAFPVYPEKARAGLTIYDRGGEQIYDAHVPERVYGNFQQIPPLIVNSLVFVEDRYLFDPKTPNRNAAIEWNRFALAVAGRVGGLVVPHLKVGGASTLATQIEKFRHSPEGRTERVGEKLRQMVTASARVYSGGRNTLQRRREIVTDYLNSTPLSSRPGYGEVIGLPDALWVWFGTDFAEANRILNSTPRTQAEWARKGEIYRQVLSLLLADRGPSYYLLSDHYSLNALTDKHLRLLNENGVIDEHLRDAALAAPLRFRPAPPPMQTVSFVDRKSTQEARAKLMTWLHLPSLYPLDRLDLRIDTSVDTAAQERVANVLQHLSDPKVLRERGMIGHQLLGDADPSKVTWSFVLYEHTNGRNLLRIHADSLNQPFDINSGAKLQLGSTAKLRTLGTYLGIMEELHGKLANLPPKELMKTAAAAPDPLTAWAASYLAKARDHSLQPMLDAAMERHYSGSPGSFFTGGGVQGFGNFEDSENFESPTVTQAFAHSVNLSFVRILQDITTYYGNAGGRRLPAVLANPDAPERDEYLHRFADTESRRYLGRFYKDFHGLPANEALNQLVRRMRPMPKRLAAVYMSLHPDARVADLREFLESHLPRGALDDAKVWDLYLNAPTEKMPLVDRAYVAGVHPLELWLLGYLQQHPDATRVEVMAASAQVRTDVYNWLFNGSAHAQDLRIRILLEQDAFEKIWQNWRQMGYPFQRLVPSLGTAIGASGDRPDALAELMGVILNDGVRQPTVDISRLEFAKGTPYETEMAVAAKPERVMSVDVARTLRRTLTSVVNEGTAARLRGTYTDAQATPLVVGGKTGTGDNRFDHFAAGGGISSSRVVDRTATFVFYLGDRFYGTVTAYVPGAQAARYHFTSGLAVQLLKSLQPELKPLLDSPPGEQPAPPANEPAPLVAGAENAVQNTAGTGSSQPSGREALGSPEEGAHLLPEAAGGNDGHGARSHYRPRSQ
ncbi:MAG TPA: transglycosylase domain-containing protein [Stellaceae bacterium]|nr:transglycosylase domain-containing protein [Stellaceae bacterium]